MRRVEPRRLAAAVLVAAAALGAALLGSCRFNYGPSASERGAGAAPTAVFVNYLHNVVTRGALSFRLTAARAETYDGEKKTVLHDVQFAEYDPDTGALVSRGRADSAVYHSDSGDADFSGDVRLESKRQDAILAGDSLHWDDKAKRLTGPLEKLVTISRSDGSFVRGAGFEAEALTRSFSFRGGVAGTLVETAAAEASK
ncbi:MAG TPA: LPS export ABC transporter periplasmic protein LptC [Rectinemataceae bacterium]|nr:LPS export ABC transporter periplasmic protein LptC [Rectinemataceae bacterium]